jgi:hypothetical protein
VFGTAHAAGGWADSTDLWAFRASEVRAALPKRDAVRGDDIRDRITLFDTVDVVGHSSSEPADEMRFETDYGRGRSKRSPGIEFIGPNADHKAMMVATLGL